MKAVLASLVCQAALGAQPTPSQTPADVLQGFFPGRSGNVILRSETPEQPRDCESIFWDASPDGDYLEVQDRSQQHSLSAFTIADVVTETLGVQPANDEGAPAFVHKNMFNRARANFIFGLESIGSDLVRKHGLSHLKQLGDDSAVATQMDYPAYPYDSVAVATSISTGSAPAQHGVVGRYWRSEGQHVTAFTPSDPSSYPMVATAADLLSQSFNGNSLTLSISTRDQLASAFSVNQAVAKMEGNNLCFASKGRGFEPCASHGASPIGSSLRISPESLRTSLMDSQSSVLRHVSSGSVSAAATDGKVTVSYPGGWNDRQEQVKFDLDFSEEAHLFMELQYVDAVLSLLGTNQELAALVKDDYPDLLSVTLTSITSLVDKYGRESVEVIGALHLVDALIPKFLDSVANLYNRRVVAEVLLMGSHSSFVSATDRRKLFQDLHVLLPHEGHLPQFFPLLYVNSSQLSTVCEMLSLRLHELKYQVFCPSSITGTMTDARFLTQSEEQVLKVDEADIALYHIVLWSSLGGAFTVLAVVYSMMYMSFKKDPMLYTSLPPEKSEAKKNR